MKNKSAISKLQKRLALSATKGFTLVELLVVIGILGILAAALIAVIDPVEQLDKASDTNKRNVTVEFLGGVSRYYATKGAYPWDAAPGGDCLGAGTPLGAVGTPLGSGLMLTGCIEAEMITNTGDLKTSFPNNLALLDEITTAVPVAGEPPVACFLPKSKAVTKTEQTIYDINGAPDAACPGLTNGHPNAACYWCGQ